jgi:hypothetical protein
VSDPPRNTTETGSPRDARSWKSAKLREGLAMAKGLNSKTVRTAAATAMGGVIKSPGKTAA